MLFLCEGNTWLHISGTNLQLFICKIFTQFFGYTFEVFERDFASFIIIEELKSFENLLFGIFFSLKFKEKSIGYTTYNTQNKNCNYSMQELEILRKSYNFKHTQTTTNIHTKAEGRKTQ